MISTKVTYQVFSNKMVIIHSFAGLLIGYFVLHPISMVIYWFELNDSSFNWQKLGSVFLDSFMHSFSLHMMPMSISFAILGLVGGIISGLFYKSIKDKNVKLYGKKQFLKQSLPSLIVNGENEFVEFKSSLRHDYRQVKTDKNLEQVILKSIAGFLNANGGTLIIGVNDNGELLGLANDYFSLKKKNKDGFQQRVILIVSNTFGRNVCSKIHISFHNIEDKEICTIIIEPSIRPIYFNEGNRTIFFLRTGNVTNPLTTSETVEYLQTRILTKT
ncbi:MAG: helix-turn-helix domain-containing protein [Salinivirgaceae bacterium]